MSGLMSPIGLIILVCNGPVKIGTVSFCLSLVDLVQTRNVKCPVVFYDI